MTQYIEKRVGATKKQREGMNLQGAKNYGASTEGNIDNRDDVDELPQVF